MNLKRKPLLTGDGRPARSWRPFQGGCEWPARCAVYVVCRRSPIMTSYVFITRRVYRFGEFYNFDAILAAQDRVDVSIACPMPVPLCRIGLYCRMNRKTTITSHCRARNLVILNAAIVRFLLYSLLSLNRHYEI